MLAWLLAAVLIVLYVAGLGLTVRWLVGAPVGLGRSLFTGIVGFFVIVPALFAVSQQSGALKSEAIAEGNLTLTDAAVAAVAALWLLALSASFLAMLEFLWPSDRRLGTIRRLRSGRDRMRRAVRYLEILRIGLRHGLGPLLRGQYVSVEEVGGPLVDALTEAGVTFVKLGQILASRRDIVGAELAEHLTRLQSQVDPEPWESIQAIISRDLGKSVRELFADINSTPLAAASIGQVHAAVLHSGEKVIVKVQRPRARAQVETDIDIALRICRRLEQRSAIARQIQATRLMAELAQSLRTELDYREEARNQALLYAAAKEDRAALRIPRVHPSLTSRRVLTVERMPGLPLAQAADTLSAFSLDKRRLIAVSLIDAVLKQILMHGVFHADLHPGNIMVSEQGELALIDFGSLGIMAREQRQALAALFAAFEAKDAYSGVIALRHLTFRSDQNGREHLLRDLGELFAVAGAERDTAALTDRLMRLLSRNGLAAPGSLAASLRTIATLQEAIAILDDASNFAGILLGRMSEVVPRQLRVDQLQKSAQAQAMAVSHIAMRLPNAIDTAVEAYTARVASHDRTDREMRQWRLRVIQAIAGCALSICLGGGALALALSVSSAAGQRELPLLGLLGATVGAVALIIGTRSAVVLSRLSSTRSTPVT